MLYVPRTEKPEKGNKFYTRKSSGGYSTAIRGKPSDVCDVLSNCVGYAHGRFNEIMEEKTMKYLPPVDAKNFISQAMNQGLACGQLPQLGACAVWSGGKHGNGHVAIVEFISENAIITSESGYGASKPFWLQSRAWGGRWGQNSLYKFLGFIYNPRFPPFPQDVVKKGMRGYSVKWLQESLAVLGYLRKNEIDGDFGLITFGALLAFQFDNKLEVDGVCGKQTKIKLNNERY